MSKIKIVQRYYATPNSFKTEDCNGTEVYITFEQAVTTYVDQIGHVENTFEPISIEKMNT